MDRLPTKYLCISPFGGTNIFSFMTCIQFMDGTNIDWTNLLINDHSSEVVSSLNLSEIKFIKTMFATSTGKQYAICIEGNYLIEMANRMKLSSNLPKTLKIGLVNNGMVVLWYGTRLLRTLIAIIQAKELVNKFPIDKHFSLTATEDRYNFQSYIKKYIYRYILNFSLIKQQESEIVMLEDYCYDDSFNRLNDGALMNYHESSSPYKINLRWKHRHTEFEAYILLGEAMLSVFNRFYGAHPNTRTDFIIGIDAENKKYELGLYRQGLKEPVVIPESVYQLIVFKNKFEDYRSENYNQPRGAWIW